jgi:hypothetical protein
MTPSYIYALYDPREPEQVRYIGQTRNGTRRPASYARAGRWNCTKKSQTHLFHWIRKIQSEGTDPAWKIIKECTADELDHWETTLIAEHRANGHPLTNMTDGGEGGGAMKGRKHSPETIAKMRAAQLGKHHTPEARAKMSAAKKGRKLTDEQLVNVRARHQDPEYRARMSASKKGVPIKKA